MTRGLLRRIAIIGGAALGLALLPLGGAGAWAGYLQATGNIHEVEPGVYRSRQLDGGQLTALLTDKGIRTVINLRGGTMQDVWYRDEVAAVAVAGARLIDIPLIETVAPDQEQMAQLLDALQHAPTPILIHCRAGADRTGFAAAVYELVVAGKARPRGLRTIVIRLRAFSLDGQPHSCDGPSLLGVRNSERRALMARRRSLASDQERFRCYRLPL